MPLAQQVQDVIVHLFEPADAAALALDTRLSMRVRALRVLAHAEIEDEIETACTAVATALRLLPPQVLPRIIVLPAPDKRQQGALRSLTRSVLAPAALVDDYEKSIKLNHGIRRDNLNKLLGPIDVDVKALKLDIDTLNDYGDKRGAVAHKGFASGATTINLPSAEFTLARSAAIAGQNVANAVRAQAANLASLTVAPSLAPKSGRFGWFGRLWERLFI